MGYIIYPFNVRTAKTLKWLDMGGMWNFPGVNLHRMLYRMHFAPDGIFGTIATISSTFVFLFVLFAAFLLKLGAGDFIIRLSIAMMGRHVSQLILENLDKLPLKKNMPLELAYHTPCHLKVQDHSTCSIELLSVIPGITVDALNSHCCGMAGTWGMMAKNYDLSKTIGTDLASRLERSPGTTGITDCPTCTMQMEAFSTKPVCHPVEIVAKSLETRI